MKKLIKIFAFTALFGVFAFATTGAEPEKAIITNECIEANSEVSNEIEEEALYCAVFDSEGNKIASCWVCNCGELLKASK